MSTPRGMTISFSTLSGNDADQGGAVYQYYFSPPISLRNTIVAKTGAGGNCACRVTLPGASRMGVET